ncbi:hypothetical protein [Pseudogulbenkiania sp. MAI-1]|uniref:hypothetical protein n=1 Tax=Pseudogulbenkiania sp. MAI-1 TaxID=990370 RepID=UPI00045EB292|nr:hypothetical protein [Pseudogulbenkiania sp. MAI-1]
MNTFKPYNNFYAMRERQQELVSEQVAQVVELTKGVCGVADGIATVARSVSSVATSVDQVAANVKVQPTSSTSAPALDWPSAIDAAALYVMRLTAHLRLRVLDARADHATSTGKLRSEIDSNLAKVPDDPALHSLFTRATTLLEKADQSLAGQLRQLCWPLSQELEIRDAVVARMRELVCFERTVAEKVRGGWPEEPHPYASTLATLTAAKANKK